MRRTFAALAFTAVLASAAASFTVLPEMPGAVAAPAVATFQVPAADGYGVGDCLAAGGECGRLVADAWCETHGYARAVEYGATRPQEGAVTLASTADRPASITVACTR
jgi:hypothetical protein